MTTALIACSAPPPSRPKPSNPAPTATSAPETNVGPYIPVGGETLPRDLDLEIPAGLSDQELADVLINRLNAWINAGSNNTSIDDEATALFGSDASVPINSTAANKAQEFSPFFENSLFIDGWNDGTHPDLEALAHSMRVNDAFNLGINLITNGSNPNDLVAFMYTIVREGDVRNLANDETSRTLQFDCFDSVNDDMNRYGEAFGQGDVVVQIPRYTTTVTFVTVNGTERIAASDG